MLHLKRDWFWGYLFIFPTTLGIFVLNLYPALSTIYLSFFKVKGLRRDVMQFVGWSNYQRLLQDSTFWHAVGNTLVYTAITVPLSICIALLLANLLNTDIRGRGFFRTVFFSPVVVPGVVLGMVWLFLLQARFGIINQLLGTNIAFTGSPLYALPTISVIGVWGSVGYNIILFIAGLQGISTTYYEAARIDGASSVRQFFSITLPLLSPSIFLVMVLSFIGGLQIFDIPFVMVPPGTPAYTNVRPMLEFYFRYAFTIGKPGIGSVVIIILLLLIMLVTALQFKLQRRYVQYDQ